MSFNDVYFKLKKKDDEKNSWSSSDVAKGSGKSSLNDIYFRKRNAKTLVSDYENLINSYNTQRSGIAERFTEDYSNSYSADYSEKYKSFTSDYNSWAKSANKLYSAADSLRGSGYFDDDDLSEILKSIDDMRSDYDDAYDAIDNDYKFRKQFADETAYNDWKRGTRLTEKYGINENTKAADIQKIIDGIDAERANMTDLQKAHSYMGAEDLDYNWLKNKAQQLTYKEADIGELEAKVADLEKRVKEAKKNKALAIPVLTSQSTIDSRNARYESLNKQYEEAYSELQNAKQYQTLSGYNDLFANEDFEEKSKPAGKIGDKTMSSGVVLFGQKWGGEFTDYYNVINDYYEKEVDGPMTDLSRAGTYMTDDERSIFNYLYNTRGEDSAMKYIDDIRDMLNMRAGKAIADNVGTGVGAYLFGLGAGIEDFGQGVKTAFNKDASYTANQHAANMISENLLNKYGKGAQVAYGGVRSFGNMIPSIAISYATGAPFGNKVGSIAGNASMFASAKGNAYKQAINEGYTPLEAESYSNFSAGSEVALGFILGGINKLSAGTVGKLGANVQKQITDKLLSSAGKDSMSKISKVIARVGQSSIGQLVGNALGEGTEEYLQEILDPVFRNVCFDENNEFKPFTEDALYSGIVGAITSMVTGGAGNLTDAGLSYQQTKQIRRKFGKAVVENNQVNDALDAVAEIAADTDNKSLQNAVDKLRKKKNITASDIGNLLEKASTANAENARASIKEIDGDTVRKAVAEFNEEIALDQDVADNVAEIVHTYIREGRISKEQREYISVSGKRNMMFDFTLNSLLPEKNRSFDMKLWDTTKAKTIDAYTAEKDLKVPETDLIVDDNGISAKDIDIASAVNGDIKLNTPDGVVSVDEAKLSPDAAELLDYARRLDDESEIKRLVGSFKDTKDVSAGEHARSFHDVYEFGRRAWPFKAALADDTLTRYIDEPTMRTAYDAGVAMRQKDVAKVVEEVKKKTVGKRGTVDKSNVKYAHINATQKAQMQAIEKIAEVTGINVVFVSSTVKNGVYKGFHGKIENGNTIYIDINAGLSRVDAKATVAMLNTMGHELTHFIKTWSPEQYAILEKHLIETYYKNGDFGRAIERYKKEKKLTEDKAQEEVIADACEMMLKDTKAIETLARKNKSLARKIANWLKDFAEKLKASFKGITPYTDAGKIAYEMKNELADIQKIWDDALVSAVENYNAAEMNVKKGTSTEQEIRYQLRAYSDREKSNWSGSKRIVLYEGQSQFNQFINASVKDSSFNKKMYFGAVGKDLATLIKNKTNIDVENYNCSLSAYEIRKILKDHGNDVKENLRGQRAVTKDDISRIPEVIQTADEIVLSKNTYNGKPVISFIKEIDGRVTVSAVVSDKHLDLFVQTAFIGIKKGNLATPIDEQASINTPKASSGTVSKNTLSHGNEKVNTSTEISEDSDTRYSDRMESEYLTERDILSQKFAEMAETEEEKQLIEDYRQNVAHLSEISKELDEVHEQFLKAWYVKKGEKRDMQKVEALRKKREKLRAQLDKADRNLLKIRAAKPIKTIIIRAQARYKRQNKQDLSELRKSLREKHETEMKEYKDKSRERMKSIREKRDADMRAYKEKVKDSRSNAVDGRRKTALKNKIKKTIKELNHLLIHGTKKKNVKEGLSETAATAIASAELLFNDDITNEDIVRTGFSTTLSERESALVTEYVDLTVRKNELKKTLENLNKSSDERLSQRGISVAHSMDVIDQSIKALDRKLSEAFERERKHYNKVTVQSIMDELMKTYKAIEDSEYSYIRNAFNPKLLEHLGSMSQDLDGATVRNMSLEQLEKLYDAYKMVLETIRNANKAFSSDKATTITEQGEAVCAEVREVGGKRDKEAVFKAWLRRQAWDTLKPVYAFRTIGTNTLMQLFNEIRKGEDIWYKDVSEAKEFRRKMMDKYNASSWDMDKKYTFSANYGKTFELTLDEVMAVYAYSRREQGKGHLTGDGIVFRKGRVVAEESKITRAKIRYEVNDADAYSLNDVTLSEIEAALTPEQRSFVIEMQEYLSDIMGEKGNEVSMIMYGVRLYKEKIYFPLKTAPLYKAKQDEKIGPSSIVNPGFSMPTQKGAQKPIVIEGFMDVWAGHVNEMSMHHAFALPLEDFRRVYNYSSYSTSDAGAEGVQATLQNAYGRGVNDYIEKLMTDLNGGVRGDNSEFMDKLISLSKVNAVFGSASVLLQQPSAVIRAMAYIDPRYFSVAYDFRKHNDHWDELKKYAPIAGIKEMGYFDTGMGQGTIDWINETEYEKFREKIGAFFSLGDSSYRSEIISRAPSIADEYGWITIWNAVKREIAEATDLKNGSREFFERCGERFTEVVTLTQVYDSVLSRSGLMRKKDRGVKMVTAFMAEPTTQMNMIVDAAIQGKRGKANVSRVLGAVTVSILVNSLLKSFATAPRDDDEDATYLEKYINSFTTDLVESFNPLAYIPYVKDFSSIFMGYDVNRMDMTLISDVYRALIALDDDKSAFEKIMGVSTSVAAFFSFPLKNVWRDMKSLYNTFAKSAPLSEMTWNKAWGSVKDGWGEAWLGKIISTIADVAGGDFFKNETTSSDIYAAFSAGRISDAKAAADELVDIKLKKLREEDSKLTTMEAKLKAKASIRTSLTPKFKDEYLRLRYDDKLTTDLKSDILDLYLGYTSDTFKDWEAWARKIMAKYDTYEEYEKSK